MFRAPRVAPRAVGTRIRPVPRLDPTHRTSGFVCLDSPREPRGSLLRRTGVPLEPCRCSCGRAWAVSASLPGACHCAAPNAGSQERQGKPDLRWCALPTGPLRRSCVGGVWGSSARGPRRECQRFHSADPGRPGALSGYFARTSHAGLCRLRWVFAIGYLAIRPPVSPPNFSYLATSNQ